MTETDNLPRWGGRPGGFETWHLTLTEPVSGQGVWIRAGLVAPRKGRPWGTAAVAAFHPANPERTLRSDPVSFVERSAAVDGTPGST
jgi:hypothetical protein